MARLSLCDSVKMARLSLCFLFVVPLVVEASVVTSLDRIKGMVLQENFILDNLRSGLKSQPKFREFYEKRTAQIRQKNFTQLMSDLNHPNGQYNTVLKYANDYRTIKEMVKIKLNARVKSQEYLNSQLSKFSDNEDIVNARLSLIRLQSIYGLKPVDMAKGIYNNVSGPTLTGSEVFLIGWTAFQDLRNKQAAAWFEAALTMLKPKKARKETYTNIADLGQLNDMNELMYLDDGTSEITIKALLGRAYLRCHRNNDAKRILTELISRAGGMSDPETEVLQHEINDPNRPRYKDRGYSDDDKKFTELCANDQRSPSNYKDPDLYCRWRHLSVPYFRFGEEILSWSPYVSLFYNVINKQEINNIKAMARKKLYQAVTAGPTGQATNEKRSSHVTWLEDWDAPMINWISQRAGRLTDLNMATNTKKTRHELSCSEPMQVVNYGLGGHYSFHVDPIVFDTPETEHVVVGSGDRLATFLLYLSDVEKGGATIFPKLNISIKPIKNSALFWYSYFPNGDVDERTLHASCPVLIGEKWVSNKWILNHGNAFKRRCGLMFNSSQKDIDFWQRRDWVPTRDMLAKLAEVRKKVPMTKAERRAYFLAKAYANLKRYK